MTVKREQSTYNPCTRAKLELVKVRRAELGPLGDACAACRHFRVEWRETYRTLQTTIGYIVVLHKSFFLFLFPKKSLSRQVS